MSLNKVKCWIVVRYYKKGYLIEQSLPGGTSAEEGF